MFIWLLVLASLLLLALLLIGIVQETRLRKRFKGERAFVRTQRFIVAAEVVAFVWLVTAALATRIQREQHAEACGWLLLCVMALAYLTIWLDLNLEKSAIVMVLAVMVLAYPIGLFVIDGTGSPEELHRDKDHDHVRPVERARPL
ncbi:hypothetical protein N5079_08405 [Planotetraspora sp. A-T 1434]|uniref:hypothetical protein n=1 Tax=Planotetraspora sp. A-T 1434 TaxID=2979219 RepID=UPI0021C21AB6|nr:hypothetical protein [Planotetraspora sp. A-T 1434]MCT9930247.1 hypothetical protein [Planotetraspora sp. A-T 1434]